MKIFFIIINFLISLVGLSFFDWNPIGLLLIYIFESFFLTTLTIYTLKKEGGNLLLNKFLSIDKEFYIKRPLTRSKASTPFLWFNLSLIQYNVYIATIVYAMINFNNPKIILPILIPLTSIIINYLINNNNKLPLKDTNTLTSYLSQPVKQIFIMFFGLGVSGPFYQILDSPMTVVIGVIITRLILDLVILKYDSLDFNKIFLLMCGVKTTKI